MATKSFCFFQMGVMWASAGMGGRNRKIRISDLNFATNVKEGVGRSGFLVLLVRLSRTDAIWKGAEA